jgi:hypothetical protein
VQHFGALATVNGHDTMTRPEWSYATPRGAARRRRPNRRAILLAAGATMLAVAGLLIWLALPPNTAPPGAANDSYARKSSLGDQPPTVILNALEPRSLYPPGYVDFDLAKQNSGPNNLPIDLNAHYDLSSSPPGCEHDPLSDTEYDFNDKNPEEYGKYPVLLIMYPVDDPGGNKGDNGFYLSVFPAKDSRSLSNFRDYYSRCQGAKVTLTVTKDGRVLQTMTDTINNVITAAPQSAAEDSFVRGPTKDSPSNQYVGLIRGMIVSTQCPVSQDDACVQLFRTALLRIWEI